MPASDRVIGVLLQRLAGQEIKLDAGALAVLLWFVQFALIVRYFQTTMTVERQYRYIARVEKEMCALYGGEVLARESASYLANYPKFSDWIHLVYSRVFPFALAFIVCWSVVPEFESRGFRSPVAWIAGALAAATLVPRTVASNIRLPMMFAPMRSNVSVRFRSSSPVSPPSPSPWLWRNRCWRNIHLWIVVPPSPSGLRSPRFGPAMKPSSETPMSKNTLLMTSISCR